MTDTPKIAEALAAFQAEMPTVAKGNRAEVPTKSGGKYTYTYADLADVTEAAMPILSKHGMAFSSCPRATERGYELTGVLLHASGERLEGALPIAGNSPQEMGSSITYMRRYLLGCMTGLVTDDDDDGNLAQTAAAKAARKRASAPQQRPPQQASSNGAVSPPQLAKIGALMGELGMTDRPTALAFVADVVGRPVESRNDLTKAEASKLIEALVTEKGAES
jgi:hypothetical protein